MTSTRPAEGERSATRGYSAQYRIAAELIYAALLDGDLEWIRVADPEAGRVDDIQVGRTGRIDAYQIKWGEYEGRLTFRALIAKDGASKDPKPSLFAQLSDGWSRLTRAGQGRVAHVHLITRASASDADDVDGSDRHFQVFLRHAWAVRATWATDAGVMASWSSAIETLRSATNFDTDTFVAFAPYVHLHLGYPLAEVDPANRSARRRNADIEHLAAFLFRLVADERRIVELDRAELVRRLGWARRLDLRFRHDFPVDARVYQPISATVAEIEAALGAFLGGYLALVGTPGSGKSTTLTQMLRYRPGHRVIRYYAFVRGDAAQGRGEAAAFLSDLTLAIRRSGVDAPGSTATIPETRSELADLFGCQLAALHEQWRANGTRTLILIDGLDHIEREQRPEHSLIDVLPSPSQVPDGVLIILGSQSIGLRGLPARTKGQLEEPGRTLTMQRLERRDVIGIATSSLSGDAMSDVDLEAVWRASAGHPLALAYLLQRLALAPDAVARRAVLEAVAPFEGEIEQDYRTHWDTLRHDAALRDLMGLLCRLRGSIDLDLLASLTSEPVLERFVAGAAHFFDQESASRWRFFHNSFRQYLLVVTGRDAFKRPDAVLQASFHRQLADACARRPGTPLGWERLHHLQGAGDTQTILLLFTQAYFRDQFMALRPLPDIQDDIATCLHAALAEDDRISVVRALLIEHELKEREQALEDVDLSSLLLRLAAPADRADAAVHDGELALPRGTALAFAGEFLDSDPALAHRLFDLAEPIAWLNGLEPVEPGHGRQWLEAWAEIAWRFHSVDRFSQLVGQLRSEPEENLIAENDSADASEGSQNGTALALFSIAASAALRAGADEVVAGLEAILSAIGGDCAYSVLESLDQLRAELAIMGRRSAAEGIAALDRLCGRVPPDAAEPQKMVAIAVLLLRLGATRERVEAYVNTASYKTVSGIKTGGANSLDDLIPLFAQARLLSALGRPLDPVATVPDDPRRHHHGAVLLQRMLVLIGTVRGEADASAHLPPQAVVRRLSPAMNLFNRSWQDARDWTDWHTVRGRAEVYFDLILRTADAHGRAALIAVLDHIMRNWTVDAAHRWPVGWRRAILMSAYALDADKDRTIQGLAALSEGGDIWTGVHDRVSHYAGQLRAWLEMGEYERAHRELAAMLQTSFGIHHRKDDQYERWCGWAARLANILPLDQVGRVLLPFVRGMVVMHGDHRGYDPDKAASVLVEAAATVSPGWAHDIFRWLMTNRGATRHAALSGLLKGVLAGAHSKQTDRNALLVAARLIVPFETTVDDELAASLGGAAQRAGPETAATEAEVLSRAIATETYQSNRAIWREGLTCGILTAGGDPAIIGSAIQPETVSRQPDSSPDAIGLTMRDGSFVRLDAVLKQHRTPARFAELAARATSADRLPWDAVLDAVLDEADAAAHATVSNAVAHLQPPLRVHTWFAGRFANLGRLMDARAAVDRAWAGSEPHGWVEYNDGGSRLVAADAAILVDGERGRRRAFEVLIRDYLGETRYPGSLLGNLDRLIAVLFADPPLEAVWSEVAEHAAQLAEIAMSSTTPVPEPPLKAEDTTAVLVNLGFGDLDHPVREIASAACKLVLDLIRNPENRPAIKERITARLAMPDDAKLEATLALLCGALDVDAGWTGSFAEEVTRLAFNTTSSIVTAHAETLLAALDCQLPSRPPRPLPTIYKLRLPPAPLPSVRAAGKPRRGQPLDDTNDPIELAGIVEVPLALVAKMSGIPLRNLTSRLAALMPVVEPGEEWDRAAEKRLQLNLDSAGLKIAYRRPRTAVACLAFGRVVQELADAGALPWPAPGIEQWLLAFDPLVSTLDASVRPDWLEAPDPATMNSWSDKGWVDRPEDCLVNAPLRLPNGCLILAERTKWIKTDRGQPTEARATQVGPYGYPWNGKEEPDHGFFLRFPDRATGAEYPMMWPPGSVVPSLPVLEGGGWLRPSFLAFSPAVAFKIGWQPSADGLFAWKDSQGARMVETLRWRDGNLLQLDRHGRDEVCGEGWVVLATVEGARCLEPLLRGWHRYLLAYRVLDENDQTPRPVVARREQKLGLGAVLEPITPGIRG